jgi:hypothetical protein
VDCSDRPLAIRLSQNDQLGSFAVDCSSLKGADSAIRGDDPRRITGNRNAPQSALLGNCFRKRHVGTKVMAEILFAGLEVAALEHDNIGSEQRNRGSAVASYYRSMK